MGTSFTDLIGEFYAENEPGKISVGTLCWAPIMYQHTVLNVIRPLSNDPANADHKKYQVQSVPPARVADEGNTVAGDRFPDVTLNLGLGEDLFAMAGKFRPVVVLFNPRARIEQVVKDGHKPEKETNLCYGCVPSYTLVDQNGNPKHKAEFVERVRALQYPLFCYIPDHGFFHDRECFLRMDRTCWVSAELLRPMKIKLTQNGRDYVLGWYEHFVGVRELHPDLVAIGNLLMEEIANRDRQAKAKLAGKH